MPESKQTDARVEDEFTWFRHELSSTQHSMRVENFRDCVPSTDYCTSAIPSPRFSSCRSGQNSVHDDPYGGRPIGIAVTSLPSD